MPRSPSRSPAPRRRRRDSRSPSPRYRRRSRSYSRSPSRSPARNSKRVNRRDGRSSPRSRPDDRSLSRSPARRWGAECKREHHPVLSPNFLALLCQDTRVDESAVIGRFWAAIRAATKGIGDGPVSYRELQRKDEKVSLWCPPCRKIVS